MLRLRASWLSILLSLLGCSGSSGSADHAAGGSHAASGSSGTTSNGFANGGSATAGASTNAGLGGGAGASASSGSSQSGGGTLAFGSASTAAGMAGASVASSGAGGSSAGGSNASGSSAGVGGRGPAPTFTAIYNTIITPNCGGAQCHLKRPTPFGYDFSSKSAASAAFRADVIAGDAENSPMFQVLNFGIMPKDKPILSIDNLYMVYDWINAGALDN